MTLTFQFLKNNTSDDLFTLCKSEYDEFNPMQKGGPLMLFLILKRIAHSSETAITHVMAEFKKLKISTIKGEDIEEVVAMIKSLHQLMLGASTPTHSYVPQDFPKLILEVLQTSSVKKFNAVFKDELELCRRASDKAGGIPDWPEVNDITNLATATYNRLKSEWNVPGGGRALTGSTFKCWNCNTDCGARKPEQCKAKPYNEAVTARNRKAFYDQRDANRRNGQTGQPNASSRAPLRKTGSTGKFKGKPLIKNKNGVYVLDSAVLHKRKKEQDLKEREKALVASESSLKEQRETMVKAIDDIQVAAAASTSPSGFSTPTPPPAASPAVSKLDQWRAALLKD